MGDEKAEIGEILYQEVGEGVRIALQQIHAENDFPIDETVVAVHAFAVQFLVAEYGGKEMAQQLRDLADKIESVRGLTPDEVREGHLVPFQRYS